MTHPCMSINEAHYECCRFMKSLNLRYDFQLDAFVGGELVARVVEVEKGRLRFVVSCNGLCLN
jgi:hypothetical protein